MLCSTAADPCPVEVGLQKAGCKIPMLSQSPDARRTLKESQRFRDRRCVCVAQCSPDRLYPSGRERRVSFLIKGRSSVHSAEIFIATKCIVPELETPFKTRLISSLRVTCPTRWVLKVKNRHSSDRVTLISIDTLHRLCQLATACLGNTVHSLRHEAVALLQTSHLGHVHADNCHQAPPRITSPPSSCLYVSH